MLGARRGPLSLREWRRCVGVIFSFFLLAACGKTDVLQGLNQREALEVVVILARAGISGEVTKLGQGKRESFGVTVNQSQAENARELLYEYNLPNNQSPPIELLKDDNGMLPNPLEVTAHRLDLVQAAELERLLEGLTGVIDARVSVRSHRNHRSSDPKTASLLLRYTSKSGRVPFSDEKIFKIVKGAIPSLSTENIVLEKSRVALPFDLSEVDESNREEQVFARVPVINLRVAKQERGKAFRVLGALILFGSFFGFVIGALVVTVRQIRSK